MSHMENKISDQIDGGIHEKNKAYENSIRPAFPVPEISDGLTKREYAATSILNAFISNSIDVNQGVQPPWHGGKVEVIKNVIEWTDELLKQLETK